MEITAEKIHAEFYSAGEKALKEAKKIIAKNQTDVTRAQRLERLGFVKAKDCEELRKENELRQEAKNLIESIQYFGQNYPNNKFIDKKAVKKICEKYNLLLGDAANYMGEIPEKNLIDIENFKLKESDYHEDIDSLFSSIRRTWRYDSPLRIMDSRDDPYKNFALMVRTLFSKNQIEEVRSKLWYYFALGFVIGLIFTWAICKILG